MAFPSFLRFKLKFHWESIGNLIFKEEVNDLMHQHAGCFGDPFGKRQALSFLTSPESGSGHLEEIQEVLRHIEVQSDGENADAPFFFNLYSFFFVLVSCFFLVFTMFYYVPLWFTMFYFYRNYILF